MIQGTLPAGVDWGVEALGEGVAGVQASCCCWQHSCKHSLPDSSLTILPCCCIACALTSPSFLLLMTSIEPFPRWTSDCKGRIEVSGIC